MNDVQKEWEEYYTNTIAEFTPLLVELGYELDADQPHIIGERFLVRPTASGRKLVLVGTRIQDNMKVIIKISTDSGGIEEIKQEQERRKALALIPFAYDMFRTPKELSFTEKQKGIVVVTEYIEQSMPFIERPIEKQFTLVLRALKAQESTHASTHEHRKLIRNVFGEMGAKEYLNTAQQYVSDIKQTLTQKDPLVTQFADTADKALDFMNTHQETIEQYSGFLTHWDFTPQNFRIHDDTLYILDNASFRFGNKYEGWARFINFMVLYNPTLAKTLITYVRLNRASEELVSLKLLRIYRLLELIHYYVGWLERTDGNLHQLARARITFWTTVLDRVLNDAKVPSSVIGVYKNMRDTLRSADEKRRQQTLH